MMVKLTKNNLEICIETEPVGDTVKFFITIPSEGSPDVVAAFKSAGFKVDDYRMLRGGKDIRFVCLVESYEAAAEKHSTFINSLGESKFKAVKQRKRKYTQKEVFAMFDQGI